MKPIVFFVPGVAQPAGSKRAFFRPGMKHPSVVDANSKAAGWKTYVKQMAAACRPEAPIAGPVRLDVAFTMARPKSHYRTGKNAGQLRPDAPVFHTHKPDALKLARGVEDALTGIMWVDDSQICNETLAKRYGPNPGVEITVTQLDPLLPSF